MHAYFSGIGGAAIGPLALIAHKAGFDVSGSDKQDSQYIAYLKTHGVSDIHIGQSYEQIAAVHERAPIDWFVYTSALPIENPDAPELRFCADHNIKHSKRDVFLNDLLEQKNLQLIAVAGTHGKTTTTAMAIWLFKQLGLPVSYSVGAKMSFGDMGEFDPASKYFVYEADEFDRNFLAFKPAHALITGIDWDHPDIYPTRESYNEAFHEFLAHSGQATIWQDDAVRLDIAKTSASNANDYATAGASAHSAYKNVSKNGVLAHQIAVPNLHIIDEKTPAFADLTLPGEVNRKDAWLVAQGLQPIVQKPLAELIKVLNAFPGIARRFERIAPNVYSDYAHTPPKIRGALQLAHEIAGQKVVVVYEGLHNTRQHFIKAELAHLFDDVQQLYIVPSYLAREDPNLPLLAPQDLVDLLSEKARAHAATAVLGDDLAATIRKHQAASDLVLCISAGGGGSLDEWLHKNFAPGK